MNLFSLAFSSSGLMTFSFFHAFEESRAEWLPGRGRRYQTKILQPVLCLMGGKIKKVKEKQPKNLNCGVGILHRRKRSHFELEQSDFPVPWTVEQQGTLCRAVLLYIFCRYLSDTVHQCQYHCEHRALSFLQKAHISIVSCSYIDSTVVKLSKLQDYCILPLFSMLLVGRAAKC